MSTNSTSSSHHSLPHSYASPPVTVILTIILLVFFFIGFFSVYFCRCFVENLAHTWTLRRSASNASPSGRNLTASAAAANSGLDPSFIDSFPTFAYSTVKNFRRRDKYGLECAICLVEFRDDAVLRLLTSCCHVFHQECIDLWLESHKTCPVCRRALDSPPPPPCKSSENCLIEDDTIVLEVDDEDDNESMDDTFSIDITRNDDDGERGDRGGRKNDIVGPCSSARQFFKGQQQKNYNNSNDGEKFPRSHSTGHSISRSRGGEDRFTLRLPEHVKLKIANNKGGGHDKQAESCIAFGELSTSNTGIPGSSLDASGSASAGVNNL